MSSVWAGICVCLFTVYCWIWILWVVLCYRGWQVQKPWLLKDRGCRHTQLYCLVCVSSLEQELPGLLLHLLWCPSSPAAHTVATFKCCLTDILSLGKGHSLSPMCHQFKGSLEGLTWLMMEKWKKGMWKKASILKNSNTISELYYHEHKRCRTSYKACQIANPSRIQSSGESALASLANCIPQLQYCPFSIYDQHFHLKINSWKKKVRQHGNMM